VVPMDMGDYQAGGACCVAGGVEMPLCMQATTEREIVSIFPIIGFGV
jgi:hypothetical protein